MAKLWKVSCWLWLSALLVSGQIQAAVTCRTGSLGVQRCSDGSQYRTDSLGVTRGSDGSQYRTDSLG